jgi:hypothetical protein
MVRALGLPGRLREVGVFREDLEFVAERVAEAGQEPARGQEAAGSEGALAILTRSW